MLNEFNCNRILLINGPNLNLTGTREPEIYGSKSLADICHELKNQATDLQMELDCFQSNHEGAIIDALHSACGVYAAVILNPGALCHYSYALRDAIAAIPVPTIEVHMSNIYSREDFRKTSVISDVCVGQITGFGVTGYSLALQYIYQSTQTAKRSNHT